MKLRHLTTSALALILIAGCGDDGTGLDADDIAGAWTATSMLFTEVAAPNDEVDLVVDEGAVLTLVLDEDGTYAFTFVLDTEDESETGTYTTGSSTITITPIIPPDDAGTFGLVRDGDLMTLTDNDTFDFNDDDVETAATLVITLTR